MLRTVGDVVYQVRVDAALERRILKGIAPECQQLGQHASFGCHLSACTIGMPLLTLPTAQDRDMVIIQCFSNAMLREGSDSTLSLRLTYKINAAVSHSMVGSYHAPPMDVGTEWHEVFRSLTAWFTFMLLRSPGMGQADPYRGTAG
jgi:acetaldehyde dehydrogenase (acetylating)